MQPDHRRVAAAVLPAGFLLGFLDFVWIKYVPYPFAQLGNSMAVWAVAAFWYGYWVRTGALRAAISASAMLVVAVPSYYVAAALIQNDDWAVIWQTSSLLWMAMGVVAGVVFGIGGIWSRSRTDRWQAVGTVLPGAVLFTEAAMHALRVSNPSYGTAALWDSLIAAVLGVVVIALAARTTRLCLRAVAVAVPLALAGLAAFAAVGIR